LNNVYMSYAHVHYGSYYAIHQLQTANANDSLTRCGRLQHCQPVKAVSAQ